LDLGLSGLSVVEARHAVGVAAGVAAGLLTREQPAGTQAPATSNQDAQPAARALEDQPEMSDGVEEFEELQAREVGGV
jgi:hypothetical protein